MCVENAKNTPIIGHKNRYNHKSSVRLLTLLLNVSAKQIIQSSRTCRSTLSHSIASIFIHFDEAPWCIILNCPDLYSFPQAEINAHALIVALAIVNASRAHKHTDAHTLSTPFIRFLPLFLSRNKWSHINFHISSSHKRAQMPAGPKFYLIIYNSHFQAFHGPMSTRAWNE